MATFRPTVWISATDNRVIWPRQPVGQCDTASVRQLLQEMQALRQGYAELLTAYKTLQGRVGQLEASLEVARREFRNFKHFVKESVEIREKEECDAEVQRLARRRVVLNVIEHKE